MSKNSGLTMIEITVVIGLFALLMTLGLLMGMDVWRGASIQSEQDIVLSLLYKARSRAVSNINEHDHGLRIEDDAYVLFEVDGDETPFDRSSGFEFSGDQEIIFTARTGNTSGYTFTMTGQGKSRTFDINEEGGITW